MMNFLGRMNKRMFKVYTDGACKKNGKAGAKGGWAYGIYDEDNTLMLAHSGHEEDTTNQRMEITAILEACKMVQLLNKDKAIFACDIHSDSAYCIRCYAEKWYDRWESNGWKTANRERLRIKTFGNSSFHSLETRVSTSLK
jgi:ribonuclease HI